MSKPAPTGRAERVGAAGIARLLAGFASFFEPRERLTVSQWAERHRRLSPESSSQPGRFNFKDAPWQREVLDEIDNPEVGSVVLMWASQTAGKTETINNMVGHKIDQDPCPIMLIQPTLEMAEMWSKDRFVPAIRDTPVLRDKVKDHRARDSGNTILHKRFPGGHITMAGANSPASLASRPIRVLFFDEVDRYPSSAGTEGDPIFLAEKRAESFPDAVTVKTSTPTIKGQSRIEKDFAESDQRYWFCQCAKCGTWQTLKWEQVKWATAATAVAGTALGAQGGGALLDCHYECEGCRAKITDPELRAMIRLGEWRSTAVFKGVRGYHMNGLYCLFRPKKPFKDRLTQAVIGFLEAKQKGPETFKVWWNTFLALTWEEPAEKPPEAKELLARCEEYPKDHLPEGVVVIIAAADVQADRIEAQAIGFGIGEEAWALEVRTFPGDPEQPHVWELFDEWTQKGFKHPCGETLQIVSILVDRGHKPKCVDDFTRPRNSRRIYSCAGSNTAGMPLCSRPTRTSYKRTVSFRVGTDTAKGIIMARLKMQRTGPRYMHFPRGAPHGHPAHGSRAQNGYDMEYFEQLTAEYLATDFRDGKIVRAWKKRRMRNEALDLWVYGLAALEVLRPNLEILAKHLAVKTKETGVEEKAVSKEYVIQPEGSAEAPKAPGGGRAPAPSRPSRPFGPSGGFVKGWK